ncbi:MAG: winged helix DNA-binding domain-containing protein [Thermoanaerobaculia bacterium]|nr:winged helix DNA-binding domain-containing protein [Thermoanaerobaculia bacterium]
MITLKPAEARKRMIAHLGLNKPLGRGAAGTRKVLERLRCIQLDPLDVIGTNSDLVVMARTSGVKRGDLWRHLFPRHAFEHFFKERCILPAGSFLHYREHGHQAETPWWRHREREQRVPRKLVDAVLSEIREHGPVSARDLTDHGTVVPIDWSGWMGTKKTTSMAVEILWTRCEIVIAGRNESGAKLYDIPERALGAIASVQSHEDFERWLLRERVRASGLLARAKPANDPELLEVTIEGSSRRYLATPEFLAPRTVRYDDRIRILGPLDPLLWDRSLVRIAFDFDYVWEVYKPASQRKWGWYVVPVLFRDRLIGRIDAQTHKIWLEGTADRKLVRRAFDEVLSAGS